MLHIDTDDENHTLNSSKNEEILLFIKTKYFVLIINNAI